MNEQNVVLQAVESLQKTVESIQKGVTGLAEKMATKDDLKGFVTKDDLKGFATKDDILDLKTELKRHATVLDWHTQRLGVIEENMATKADMRRTMDHIDFFAHKVDVFDKKVLVHDHRLNEIETKI